ncbi:hypothetical protein L3H50_05860 [Corynebacterium sp. MC-04]|uniref:Cobalamin biosynthesis protein CbiX n=2 Tax=Corynebacterium parakroppenstedtii TaxID=2828363 RepID=A0ABS9HKB1_9CORY|nr:MULTISPECIES: hypothetical protein [Corynebacterium]KXB50589.1 hypothetical protein HMPREF1861_01373 [Corynebacterium kroppenstedtii]MBY0793286.1 hypothetical protein [Corynebacterium parakroppenstedtii]MCF6769792.1 hypothetical protein [Corynebacterium parakroppenstedtii]MCF6771566.1 hypothetical protein [Corynebacterium parakroppenstedtii]MCF6773659.1 hypothetical protein [Corynebacterium parakroppenstedtii]
MIILFCGAEAHNDELIREVASRLHQFRLVDVAEIDTAGTGSAARDSMPGGHNLEPIVLTHSTSEVARALTAGHHENLSSDDGHSPSTSPDNQPPTVIIPMTAGRDLHSITALAQAIQWWKRSRPSARVIISDPIGNSTTRVSALRANMRSHPAHSYVVVSVALDPFFDADLFRDARLAWQYSNSETSVAFDGAAPGLPEAIHRAEILFEDQMGNQANESGVERIVVLRADLLPPNKGGYQTDGRSYHEVALWSPSALAVLIETNVVRAREAAADVFNSSAENDAAHGIDGNQSSDDPSSRHGGQFFPVVGLEEALWADHDSGFAHSHAHDEDDSEDGHAHSHIHPHSHIHSHHHPHPHTHSHTHSHGHAHHHHVGHTHSHGHSHNYLHEHETGSSQGC